MITSRRQLLAMVLLVTAGALGGCIPIPSTQRYMTNGNVTPSREIGPTKPIRPGHTRIDDAMAHLNWHLVGEDTAIYPFRDGAVEWEGAAERWRVTSDRRQYSTWYLRRTGWLLMPFALQGTHIAEYLVLDVDAEGIVTGHRVLTEAQWQDMTWFYLIDGRPDTRSTHATRIYR